MRTTTDVLIVGAGPVGLMLAGELQRRGVDYILVEREREPVPFCKALGVTPRTLEIWDQIGVLEHALRSGRFTCSGPTGTSAIAPTGSTASGWRPTCSRYSASDPV